LEFRPNDRWGKLKSTSISVQAQQVDNTATRPHLSVGLTKVVSSPVGTIVWDDLELADAFFFGQNPGSNIPRFLPR